MEKLAIFDVDFTLTSRESLLELYLYMLKKNKKLIRFMPNSLKSAIFYSIGAYNAKESKEKFMRFFDGIKIEEFNIIVKDFYKERLSKILYNDGINALRDFSEKGYKVYLISASPEVYLNEFYNIKQVDKVIGTKLIIENGVYRNIIDGENCKGEEKVRRLKEFIDKEKIKVDFENSFMYSDSLSDLPLFNLVGNPYLINYKKKHKEIVTLKWS
ncbi:HAD-IB family hydrolase [Clostridium sp. DL1XJH146]